MKNSTKKWLTVAGCLAICAVLIFVIAGRFSKEPATDDPLPTSSSQPVDVVVDEPDKTPDQTEKKDVVIKPEITDPTPSPDMGGGAVSSGTEQTIQPDPVKPEPDEDALKDPTQKPDGTPVEGTIKPEDHNNVTPPPAPPSTNTGGGLPGYDHVPNAGPNQVTEANDMYENGNKIGIMD